MASYDDRSGRRYEPPRNVHDTRYVETRETYRGPASGQELVPRTRNDNELSVEPYEHDRDIRRARSAEPYYDNYYDRYDYERHHPPRKSTRYDYEYSHERSRRRVISKEQKIMAALAGAALFAGGKELYDRYEAKEDGTDVHRNPLASAALGAAGALAGYHGAEIYEKRTPKTSKSKHVVRARDGRVVDDYWDDDDSDTEYYHEKGNKTFIEKAIAATGLAGALKAAGSHDDRSERSYRTRSRRGSRSSSRSSRRSEPGVQKMQQAAMASLLAGASEAFRVSKQPGSWKGEKTKRVLTAAISAGGIGAAHDSSKHEKLGLLESVMGGLLANRAIRGSKKDIEEDSRTGRSRSRSRARSRSGNRGGSAIAGPLAAIAGAIAAKKAVDHSRSGSRGRHRDASADSHDSRRSQRSLRDRSRSAVRKGLAKMGIGSEPDRYDDDEYYEGDRRHHRDRDYDDDHHSQSKSASRRDKQYESDSDLGNSDEDNKQYRKMRGKSIITTGLATMGTIHAAHGVVQSYEKRQQRQKAVREGRLDPEEARKLKGKALLQDAASIGIAALGIRGAISEMKDAKEMNAQLKHWKKEKRSRHERRMARQQQLKGAGHHPRRRADGYYTTSPVRSRRYYGGYEGDYEHPPPALRPP